MNTRRSTNSADFATLALFAVFAAALMWLFFLPREPSLPRGATGFDGLARWLRAEGVDASIYRGRYALDADNIALRVLPLYDTDLDSISRTPETKQDVLMKEDEVDFESRTIDQKIGSSLTLIALPKWRQGMRLSRTAHPVVLNDASSIARLQNQFSVKTGPLAPTGRDFETFDYRTTTGEMLTAMIYAPQLVGAGECTPIIGDRDHMLLGTCNAGHPSAPGTLVYVLSDPDLINNHGLALGENARIAADLFADLANDGRVLVDYSTNHWTMRGRSERPDRTWSDFARFFDYPFTLLWASFILICALTLWRAWVRFGATIPDTAEAAPEASKTAAIDAKARLLRLAGHDGALLSAYVEQRLQFALSEIFGPHAPHDVSPLDAVVRFLERRNANRMAEHLRATTDAARSLRSTDGTSQTVLRLDQFELVVSEVLREFGRTAHRR